MLSIRPKPLIAAEAEKYFKKDNYYLESEGEWGGELANSFNLEGEPKYEDFSAYLRGFTPSGEKIVASAGGKDLIDQETGKVKKTGHRAGIDMTFSCPKSVSVLAFTDPRIEEAFKEAVSSTMSYAEDKYVKSNTRVRQEDGSYKTRQDSGGGMLYTSFVHKTSRELDPQLHSHCVVYNMTKGSTGKTKVMNNSELYKNKFLLGQMFRTNLADKVKELGYKIEITDPQKGFFEIAGVGHKITGDLSLRSKQIKKEFEVMRRLEYKDLSEAKLLSIARERNKVDRSTPIKSFIAAHRDSTARVYSNFSDSKLKEICTLSTRKNKKNVTPEQILEKIENVCMDCNITLEELEDICLRNGNEPQLSPSPKEIVDYVIRDLTQMQSAFTEEQCLQNTLKLGLGAYSVPEMLNAYSVAAQDNKIITLGLDQKRNVVYTSPQMIDIENRVITNCKNGIGNNNTCVDPNTTQEFIRETNKKLIEENGYGFTNGQIEAIDLIATSKSSYNYIQGDAGSGKSFSMKYAKDLLEENGKVVRGFAPTGKASQELATSAEIETSQTVDSFLLKYYSSSAEKQSEIFQKNNEVWIVDESGMMGSRKIKMFMNIAEEAGAKVVFVGDQKQFASIEAGKIFTDIQTKTEIPGVEMPEVMRQKTPQTQAIVAALSDKDYVKAFENLQGKIFIDNDVNDMSSYKIGQSIEPTSPMVVLLKDGTEQILEIGSTATIESVNKNDITLCLESGETGVVDLRSMKKELEGYNDNIDVVALDQIPITLEDGTQSILAANDKAKVHSWSIDEVTITLPSGENADVKLEDYKDALFEDAPSFKVYETRYENVISETIDRDDRLKDLVIDYLESQYPDDVNRQKDTMIITGTNKDRTEINSMVREELVNKGEVTNSNRFTVKEANSLGGVESSISSYYQVGQEFNSNEKIGEMQKGAIGRVKSLNSDLNEMTVNYWSKEERVWKDETFNISKHSQGIQTYNLIDKDFGEGDKIVFLKNDKMVGVSNGQTGQIISLEENGDAQIQLKEKTVSLNIKDFKGENPYYGNLDHAYCLSEYKAQGATVDKLIWHAPTDTGNLSTNSSYVAITRCKNEVAVYTDSTSKLYQEVQQEQHKYSTMDRYSGLDEWKVDSLIRSDSRSSEWKDLISESKKLLNDFKKSMSLEYRESSQLDFGHFLDIDKPDEFRYSEEAKSLGIDPKNFKYMDEDNNIENIERVSFDNSTKSPFETDNEIWLKKIDKMTVEEEISLEVVEEVQELKVPEKKQEVEVEVEVEVEEKGIDFDF
jgi:conjugative relaxase-like TrwC/TraI family protein